MGYFPTNTEEPPEPHPGQVVAAGGKEAGRNSRGGGERGEDGILSNEYRGTARAASGSSCRGGRERGRTKFSRRRRTRRRWDTFQRIQRNRQSRIRVKLSRR